MSAPEARHGRLRPRSGATAILRLVGIAVAVALTAATSIAAIAVWSVASSVGPGVDLAGQDDVPPSIGAIEGEVNLLLVGSDSGGGDPSYGERGETLNDVTMLLHISADHTKATVVSFPRDLYVTIPECPQSDGGSSSSASDQKINTSLAVGGLACTVLTVERLTGFSIPFAAVIEFNGVIAMSNAVGGVPVCVAEKIEDRYTGLFLDPGEYTLSGAQALQFLRTRHGLATGADTARISNQQVFLSSLVRTIKSTDTLTNPVKLYGIAKAATENMTFSRSLQSPDTMVAIALALKDIPLDEVVFAQYPSYSADNGLYPRQADADALMAAIASDQSIALAGQTGAGAQLDPNAPTPTAAPTATADPSATPTPAPTTGPSVELPESVTGQTAGQYTCSVGRTLQDQ